MILKRHGYLAVTGIVAAVFIGLCMAGSRAVTVMAEIRRTESRTRIVIDAGHGGVDGGATSCTGKLESGYNLEISLRLRDLFHLLGIRTEMIRTTDTSVYTTGDTIAKQKMSDLKERVRIANREDRSILISIHQNNFPDSRYSGAQVFYPETQNSRELAEKLQSALVQSINRGSSRKVKKASGIYVMENIQCTGILVECGFLSNPEEEARLSSPDYQQKLCCVITATVKQFIEKEYANT